MKHLEDIKHPMEHPPYLEPTLAKALRMMISKGGNLNKLRRMTWEELKARAKTLEPERAAWVAELHPDVAKVIGHLHLPLLDNLLQ